MQITFNRVETMKKAFDKGLKSIDELTTLTLDYYILNAITESEKGELLNYLKEKTNQTI